MDEQFEDQVGRDRSEGMADYAKLAFLGDVSSFPQPFFPPIRVQNRRGPVWAVAGRK